MPKYRVTLLETLMRHAVCVVEAPNEKKATTLALKVKHPAAQLDTEQIIERDVWTVEETK
jgi:hypothetical protein